MDTALYYTFSTIAQALAAAMALLAAFALYALQTIDSKCAGATEIIKGRNIIPNASVDAHARVHDWHKYFEAITSLNLQVDANRRLYDYVVPVFSGLLADDKAIRTALWQSGVATAVVMAGSVAALALVPVICRFGVAGVTLGIGV